MRDYVNNPPSEVSYRGELLTTAPGAVSRSLSTRNDSSVGQIGIGVITLPIIVSAIKRQKWLVVGLGVAGLLLGLLLFLSTDPVYESTVQIELNSDTARSIETDDGNRSLAQRRAEWVAESLRAAGFDALVAADLRVPGQRALERQFGVTYFQRVDIRLGKDPQPLSIPGAAG